MAARAQMFPKAGWWFLAYFALALVAFWPSYFATLPRGPDGFVHAHAAGVLLWMLLLISQPFLIARRRWDLHRRFGRFSYVLVPWIVVTALLLASSRIRAMSQPSFAKDGHSIYLPLVAIVLFVVCYGFAIAKRKSAALHGGYMIATALPLVDPIVARLLAAHSGITPGPIAYPLIGYGLTDLALLALIWFDRRSRNGREAFIRLLPVFLLAHIGWFTLAQTQAWLAFAAWFRSLPLT